MLSARMHQEQSGTNISNINVTFEELSIWHFSRHQSGSLSLSSVLIILHHAVG